MPPATTVPRRTLVLASIVMMITSVVILLPGSASAGHDDCRVDVRGPFFYAGFVFPVGEIRCDTVKQSIHIDVSLDMDGVEVASASRTCRKASRCILGLASDGVFARDVAGDQLWCGGATGSIDNRGPRHVTAEAASCESEGF